MLGQRKSATMHMHVKESNKRQAQTSTAALLVLTKPSQLLVLHSQSYKRELMLLQAIRTKSSSCNLASKLNRSTRVQNYERIADASTLLKLMAYKLPRGSMQSIQDDEQAVLSRQLPQQYFQPDSAAAPALLPVATVN